MRRTENLAFLAIVALFGIAAETAIAEDTRDIATGYVIPDEGYCDQPYVVITQDGNWLCLLTTAGGHEGAANSHVVSTISADQGRTWSELVELEPVEGEPAVRITGHAAAASLAARRRRRRPNRIAIS